MMKSDVSIFNTKNESTRIIGKQYIINQQKIRITESIDNPYLTHYKRKTVLFSRNFCCFLILF